MGWKLEPARGFSEEQTREWLLTLERRTGVWLGPSKGLLRAGINHRMRALSLEELGQYWQVLEGDGGNHEEWFRLVDLVSNQATRFFRDDDAYEFMRRWMQLRINRGHDMANLMFWSAGCASGEEAYSMAMVATDVYNHANLAPKFGVIGTDISKQALLRASRGVYRERTLQDIIGVRRALFFRRVDERHFRVTQRLREKTCFLYGNLLQAEDPPLLKVDVIFCQNVLIYLRKARQQIVLERLVKQLKRGGLLVIGQSEASGWRHPQLKKIKHRQVSAYIKQ